MPENNYKDTINLPKTAFPMKGNLPTTEPKRIEKWAESTYQKIIEQNKDKPLFVMPDGPPYANGNIHLGHVLNKVLKDIVIKYKNMSGHKAVFIPGWDCHGLPIELKVTKKLGSKRKEMSDEQVRDLCRQEALKWVNEQRQQFVRLGILADWKNPYLTLHPHYEAEEVRVLAQIHKNGILYRGEKPVNWCPALQTALAAAEVEYHDHTSPSIYVKFNLQDDAIQKLQLEAKTSIVIWTTTPWTLPANLAIALHKDFEYGLYKCNDEHIVIATELKEKVEQDCEIELQLIKTLKGSEFEGLAARHPFLDQNSQLVLGDHVTLEAGSGCVHTAPGHGLDDYQVGLKYGLPVYSPVDPAGRYTSDFKKYEGVKIWDANDKIVEDLKASEHLLGYKKISHSYPHNPRTKTPLIFRATPQWFVRMDDAKYNLREKALQATHEDIAFYPQWGQQRLHSMLTHSPDWCLSRQRIWGVPIPVFYCKSCGHELINSDVMMAVADKIEACDKGLEAYFSEPVESFIGNHQCSSCGHTEFKRGEDILDVWFDSGVCHTAVQKKRDGLSFPADIYLEGSDQHRGWFQTSLLSSLASDGQPPYKALVTHGFVNDAQGHKMSKSKGNVIDPADVIKKSGAEILRLWVAYEDYGQDVNISNEMFQRVTETYRRIRNTMRFFLGNLNDFNYETDRVEFKDMPALDRWALIQLNELIEKTETAYENFDFYKVYHALNHYFTVVLSATYLDIIKDRLYTWKTDGLPRRASQTVLFESLSHLLRIMAPILSFLAEETYEFLPGNKKESVFLESFPKVRPEWNDNAISENFSRLLEIRSEASKVLEDLRKNKTIGSSLDARLKLNLKGKDFELLQKFSEKELREIFIVSQLEFKKSEQDNISAEKATGQKCVRCWNYSEEIGQDSKWTDICPKCIEALQ